MTKTTRTVALGLAGAFALAALVPASAAPLMPNSAVKSAVGGQVTDVRWRGRGIGPGIGLGIAAGALVGAAVAGTAYGPNYYYDQPVYGGPVYDAPVYAQPYGYDDGYAVAPGYSYNYGRCFTDEGYGRRRPCSASK